MSRIKLAKPSPALTVAVVALVAALAGTAIAGSGAHSSGKAGKALKRANKATKKAKKANRNAKAAQGIANDAQDSANEALGQQETFSYSTAATAATTTLFEGGGLRIEGRCPGADVEVDARSLADSSIIHLATNIDQTDAANYDEDDDFDTNDIEPLDVFDYADGVQGTFTFRNGEDGTIITATYLLEEDPQSCEAYGNVEILGGA
jgi:hypothetical protein